MPQTERIAWIETPQGERLAIGARPRGGEWLADAIQGWKNDGVDAVVALLESPEMRELELEQEPALCRALGIDFESFPVADRGLPESMQAVGGLVHRIGEKLMAGQGVLIHCRIGIGRSAMIAACVLADCGVDADDAFARITRARAVKVPDTDAQRDWTRAYAEQVRRKR